MEIASFIVPDFVALEEDAPITELIGKLKQYEKRSGIVFRNKKYVGLVEKRKLLRSHFPTNEAKVGHFAEKTPIVNEQTPLLETAALLFSSSTDVLPVERNKVIIGVVSALAIAVQGVGLPEAVGWKVRDVKLITVEPLQEKDPVAAAIHRMHESHADHIPLMEEGKLAGIISYRDILRKYLNWSPRRDVSRRFNKMASTKSAEVDMPHLASLPVRDFCSTDIQTTFPEQSLQQAVQILVKYNLTCLPVVQGERFLGLLTAKQILGKIASIVMQKNYAVQFIGLNTLPLESSQKSVLQKIADMEALKLQRYVKSPFTLVLHLKVYDKAGTRQKYAVNVRLEGTGHIITSSQNDWDAELAVRKALENIRTEVQKKNHPEKKRQKGMK